MSMKDALQDREYLKFREYPSTGQHSVSTKIENTTSDPIPVNIVSGASGSELYEQFNEVASVATSALTSILTYTVPAGKEFKFMYAEAGGTNISDYRVKVNGTRISRKRTYLNGDMWVPFDFRIGDSSGKILVAGDVLIIETIHDRPDPGDFEARMFGILENA